MNKDHSSRSKKIYKTKSADSDHFSIAGYIDPHTIITKNGEIMQTIEIVCNNNDANISGLLRDTIRKAISSATIETNSHFSFWIHTVKTKIDSLESQEEIKLDSLERIIVNSWENYSKTFNNYSTVTYITILMQGLSFHVKPTNILLYTNKALLYRKHNLHIRRSASILSSFTKKILSNLETWNAKRLSIVKRNDEYFSEHLEFLDQIVNLSQSEYVVPISNLSKIINRSKYHFGLNFGALNNKNGSRFFSIFSIKDCHGFAQDSITDLINSLGEITFCEILHFDAQIEASKSYKDQYNATIVGGDTVLDRILNVQNFFNNSDDHITCLKSVLIVAKANTISDLKTQIHTLSTMAAKFGLIIAQEDIGVERAFYSTIPGNFNYIGHSSIVLLDDIGTFIYSHTMDNENIQSYVNKSPLFMVPTFKNNPYAFGILEDKSNILIIGEPSSGKTIFVNFILSYAIAIGYNIYIMDTNDKSYSFVKSVGGNTYSAAVKRDINSLQLNPIQHNNNTIDHNQFLTNLLSLFAYIIDMDLNESQIQIIASATLEIKENPTKFNTMHDVATIFSGTFMEGLLLHWHSIGKASHILDNPTDSIDADNSGRILVNIHSTVLDSQIATAIIAYCTIYKFISKLDKNKRSIIVLYNVFDTFSNKIFNTYLESLMETAKEYGATIIMTTTGVDDIKSSNLSRDVILKNCNTLMHLKGSSLVNEEYGDIFGLASAELYALNNLASKRRACILKQNGLTIHLNLDLDPLGNSTINILSDEDSTRTRIKDYESREVLRSEWIKQIALSDTTSLVEENADNPIQDNVTNIIQENAKSIINAA